MAWLLGLVLYFAPAPSQAQVITEGPDSVRVPVEAVVMDTINEEKWF